MADFFTFLGTFVQGFITPLVGMINSSRLVPFLGTSLLWILLGFWIIHTVYNTFISHRDSLSSSNYSQIIRSTDNVSYSSAYRGNGK